MIAQAPQTLWQSIATPLRLLAVALFLFVTCGPSVVAQNNESGASFFVRERQLQDAHKKALPGFQIARPARPRRPYKPQPQPQTRYASQPATVEKPPDRPPPSWFVAVMGDSLAVLLAQGLQEAFADRGEIGFLRKGRESSGLVREDFYNWQKAVADMLAGGEHVDLAVMMIGSNDRQAMRDGAQEAAPLTPRWRELYAARVDAIAALFRERNVKLLWVGMPVMKNEKLSAELAELNEIYRQGAARNGALYIDIWDAFLNDGGKYDAGGPDVNGAIVKLRTGDGIHFTKPGARKLAHFLEAEVKRAFEQAKPAADPALAALLPQGGPLDNPAPAVAPAPVPAAPVPVNPQTIVADAPAPDLNQLIRRQIGAPPEIPVQRPLSAEASLQASLVPPPDPPPIFIPVKPAAGPVMLLTSPALAPSGELARRGQVAPGGEAQALIDQAFQQGRLPLPRAGRADAFAWPGN